MNDTAFRYLYLHGFASSRNSRKGVELRERLAGDGVDLELLELNVPSFERQTYSSILEHLDRVDADTPPDRLLRLTGSSMGGYLATRWTELNPGRVDRLALLCPGFDLTSRWPLLLGADAFARWEADGEIPADDGTGQQRRLHWHFVEDARTHPAYPDVTCPTRIIHGSRDEVVPIDTSRRYAETRPHVSLLELDDDHSLTASIDRIAAEMRDHFDLA